MKRLRWCYDNFFLSGWVRLYIIEPQLNFWGYHCHRIRHICGIVLPPREEP